jgi:hypothetical protein
MNRRRTSQLLCSLIAAAGLLTACAAENTGDPATAGTTGVDGSTGDSTTDSTGDSTTDSTTDVPTAPSSVSAPPVVTIADEGSTPVSTDGIDPGLQPYIDIAVADLAKRVSIDESDVGVISATLVSWPDAALGCPRKGQQYPQVTTDGSVIVLKVGDKLYRYHSGGSRKPFLCEQP